MSDVPPRQPAVGPLAQEAALLLEVVADRLTSMKPDDPGGRTDAADRGDTDRAETGGGETDAPAVGTGRAERGATDRCPECGALPDGSCTACPLCRFLAVLRGERPEATARLVDGALLIVRTLRSLIPETAEATDRRPPPAARPDAPGTRAGGLEHIDIR